MRPPAQLLAVEAYRRTLVRNGHHANVVLGILVAEEGQRAGVESLFERSDAGLDFRVLPDLFVHLVFDVAQLLEFDLREMREVEAQAIGRVQ